MTQRSECTEHRDFPACPCCTAVLLDGVNDAVVCAGCEYTGCHLCTVPKEGERVRLCDGCRMTGAHRSKETRTAKVIMAHMFKLVEGDPKEYMLKHNLAAFAKVQRKEIYLNACKLLCQSCTEGNKPKLSGRFWIHTQYLAGDYRNGRCGAQRLRFALAREED